MVWHTGRCQVNVIGKRNYKTAMEEEINKGQCSVSDLREKREDLTESLKDILDKGYFEKLLIYSWNNK